MEIADDSERRRVGQCLDCARMDRVVTGRGSVYYRCRRAEDDSTFDKYPRLPVVDCRGHEPRS